jgi:inorganic pyrophosphatase
MRKSKSIELLFGHLPAGDDVPAELNAIIRLSGRSTAVSYEPDERYKRVDRNSQLVASFG